MPCDVEAKHAEALAAPQRLTLKRPGPALCYYEWSPRAAPTVLLIHGHLDIARTWDPVAARLAARGMRVLVPDLRGHGDSEWGPAGVSYQFWDFVADLADVIAATQTQRAMVAGHSLGALLALAYAAAFPRNVERLALLEGVAGMAEPVGNPAAEFVDHMRRMRLLAQRGRELYSDPADAAGGMRKADPLATEESIQRMIEHGTHSASGGVVFKHDPRLSILSPLFFAGADARSFLRGLTCPLLALDGGRSGHRNGSSRVQPLSELVRQLSSTQPVVIPDAGHSLVRHTPEQVTTALEAFFSSKGGGADSIQSDH